MAELEPDESEGFSELAAHRGPPFRFRGPNFIGREYRAILRTCWLIVWGMFCPVVFLLAVDKFYVEDLWQSGEYAVYCILLFRPRALRWLYPLLAFSACGLGYHVFRSRKKKPPTWMLFAVLSGAVLWLEIYFAWCGITLRDGGLSRWFMGTFVGFPIAGLILIQPPVAIAYLVQLARGNDDLFSAASIVATVLIVALAALVYWGGWILCVAVAVPLALSAYVWASIELYGSLRERWRVSIATLMLVFIWFSVNLASWRRAVLVAIDEYNRLPTEPPDTCFIITAAAQGHASLVGSRDVGQSFRVTRQLQLLKALELLLHTTLPSFHRRLRRIYNRVGPAIARRIRFSWLADVVYLTLKPAEWFAWLVVRVVAGVPRSSVRRVYHRPN